MAVDGALQRPPPKDLVDEREEALLKLAAEAPPGSDGLLMLPYLLSAVGRSPAVVTMIGAFLPKT